MMKQGKRGIFARKKQNYCPKPALLAERIKPWISSSPSCAWKRRGAPADIGPPAYGFSNTNSFFFLKQTQRIFECFVPKL